MGLKKFVSGKTKIVKFAKKEKMEAEKDKLIRYISERSSRNGDKLLEFMSIYRLDNLQSATVEQLREYIATHAKQLDDAEITK